MPIPSERNRIANVHLMSVLYTRPPRNMNLVRRRASGSTIVEAAIVMPFMLVIILASINLIILCVKSLRFQNDFAQVTRETFTKGVQAREADLANATTKTPSWRNYFETNLARRAQQANLSLGRTDTTQRTCSSSLPYLTDCTFIAPNGATVDLTNSTTPIRRGFIFRAAAESTESIFPTVIPSWMSSFRITLRAKAVSVVQMTEGE